MIKREDFGKPFAIHASREIDLDVYDRIKLLAPELYEGDRALGERDWYKLSRVTSAILAVVTIETSVVEFTRADGSACAVDLPTKQVLDLGDQQRWFFGPFGYVLRDDVRALATPVPCRGWQGFWTLPDDVTAWVEEQLR